MEAQRLIHMANQIGAFFAAEPDRSVALEGIVNHLKRFWDPRMRKQIVGIVDAQEDSARSKKGEGSQATGLTPLVSEAIRANRERLLGLQRVT